MEKPATSAAPALARTRPRRQAKQETLLTPARSLRHAREGKTKKVANISPTVARTQTQQVAQPRTTSPSPEEQRGYYQSETDSSATSVAPTLANVPLTVATQPPASSPPGEPEFLSSSDARADSEKSATKAELNSDDRNFLDVLHAKYLLWLTPHAKERGISVEQIEHYWGSATVFRAPTGWNEFHRDEVNRSLHCGGVGVEKASDHSTITERWAKLTVQEKAEYEKKAVARMEYALDSEDDEPIDRPETDAKADRLPNRVASEKVKNFVDLWTKQANNVSRRYNVQFILIGASENLGPDHFQAVRGTTKVSAFIKAHTETNPKDYFPGHFQAHVAAWNNPLSLTKTTEAPKQVAHSEEPAPKFPKPSDKVPTRRHQLLHELDLLITKATNNRVKSWPWSKRKERLGGYGFKVKLHPKSKTEAERFNSIKSTGYLRDRDIEDIQNDLRNGYLTVVPDTDSTDDEAASGDISTSKKKGEGSPDQSEADENGKQGVWKRHIGDDNRGTAHAKRRKQGSMSLDPSQTNISIIPTESDGEEKI